MATVTETISEKMRPMCAKKFNRYSIAENGIQTKSVIIKQENIMEQDFIVSKKRNFRTFFAIAWGIVALLLIATIIYAMIYIGGKYADYKMDQKDVLAMYYAVHYSSMYSTADEITSEIDAYSRKEYIARVKSAYSYLTRESAKLFYNGTWYVDEPDPELVAERILLRAVLEEAGYDFDNHAANAYYYFEHTNIFTYAEDNFINEYPVLCVSFTALPFVLLFFHLLYIVDRRKTMAIGENRVICKKGKKVAKEFFIKDVKSVESMPFGGLKIRGNNFKYRINLLKNAPELKTAIMASLESLSASAAVNEGKPEMVVDTVEQLKQYKELLDSGVITQEEFDAKKQQLLEQ